MNGEVMGINTAIQSGTGQSAGIGFAVPSNTISKVVPVLIIEGKYLSSMDWYFWSRYQSRPS